MIHMKEPKPKPWVNKHGKIQLRAHRKRSILDARYFVNVLVRTQAAHQATPPRDSGTLVAAFPLVDDPDVSHRVQANRYLRIVALALGHAEFEGRYALWKT